MKGYWPKVRLIEVQTFTGVRARGQTLIHDTWKHGYFCWENRTVHRKQLMVPFGGHSNLNCSARPRRIGVFYFVLMQTLREEKHFKVLVFALIAGSVLVSPWGAKEFLFEGKTTLSSSWGHKNLLGFFLEMIASLLIVFSFFSEFGARVGLLSSVALLIIVTGITAVFCRGALISLLIFFAAFCLIAGYG